MERNDRVSYGSSNSNEYGGFLLYNVGKTWHDPDGDVHYMQWTSMEFITAAK